LPCPTYRSDVNARFVIAQGSPMPHFGTSRRDFLRSAAFAGYTLGVESPLIAPIAAVAQPSALDSATSGGEAARVKLMVNGLQHALDVDTRTTLLDALREHIGLTGTKKGCDHGQCGACTVLLNGRRVNSCLTLAVMLEGDDIKTIEGLGTESALHPLQAAFIAHDGFQCGYCTAGQICSAVGMLAEAQDGWPSHVTSDVATSPMLTTEEIAERMSGNLCRCAAYPNIVSAIESVANARAG
jgi:xanthine dehydrogenase YagT iron-sulfur-binding subunit